MRSTAIFLGASVLFASAGLAQNAPLPARIAGTIQQVNPQSFTVKTADGNVYTVAIGPMTRLVADVPIKVTEIKVGEYIATDVTKGADGKWRSKVGHTQDQPFGGGPQGPLRLRPTPNQPDAARILGIVESVTPAAGGAVVTAKIDDGEVEAFVPSNITFYHVAFDGPALLKPGLAVDAPCDKAADGTLVGRFVTVEKNGFKPVDD